MHTEAIKAAYRRYARVYDTLFGPILHPGRKLIVESLECRPGERILEVGVGTGLSLPLYPETVRVTGIDLSREMLAKARARVEREQLPQVEALVEMDAESMAFADSSFEKVIAMYVVSVARHPTQLLNEMRRVCRPGGQIFVLNHFRSEGRLVGALERSLAGFSAQIGFHPDLALGDLLQSSALELEQVSRINFFWRILRFRNRERTAASRPKVGPVRAPSLDRTEPENSGSCTKPLG